MIDRFQRPLVFGSATVVTVIGLLELLNHTMGEWSVYGLLAISISAGVWWVQKPTKQRQPELTLLKYVDSTLVQQTLSEAEQVLGRLQTEVAEGTPVAGIEPQVSLLQSQISQIASEIDREAVRLLVMGSKGSGKTSLIQQLQSDWQTTAPKPVSLLEAPSFSVGTEMGLAADAIALKQAMTADLILFLVTGDLTDSELHTLKQLATRKRTVLVFNKQDQYLPEERELLLNRMRTWGQGWLKPEDVIAIATDPRPLKVRRYQEDGSLQEWLEDQQADVAALTQRLTAILQTESRQLVLASSLGNAKALKAEAAAALNDVRRTRALPIVEQFQWIAAGTAFASPIPSLDVVATAAINAQMILDLGKIYQQKFSIDQAQKVVTALGSLILKLGLVELSTRAISSLLKTNAVTYIAGGCIQAISAAYLTRIAGLTLIEYFHTQEPNLTLADAKPLAIERLGQVLQTVFQQNQQTTLFQTLTGQVLDRLNPKPATSPAPVQMSAHIEAPPISPPTPLEPLQTPLKLPEPAIAETVPTQPLTPNPLP